MNNIAPTNVTYTPVSTSSAGIVPIAPAASGKRVLVVGLVIDPESLQECTIRDTAAQSLMGVLHVNKHAPAILPPCEIGYQVTPLHLGLELFLANSVLTGGVILWRYID